MEDYLFTETEVMVVQPYNVKCTSNIIYLLCILYICFYSDGQHYSYDKPKSLATWGHAPIPDINRRRSQDDLDLILLPISLASLMLNVTRQLHTRSLVQQTPGHASYF
jgi:hypothetical protein